MRLYAGPERSSEEIATLLFAESLEVSSINDERIPTIPRIIRSGERRFDLLPGGYDVVLYYDVVWPLNANEDEVVHSESWRLRLELEAGHSYRVEHRLLLDLDDARRWVRDLKLVVVDLSSGEPVQIAATSERAELSTPLVVNPVLAASPFQALEDNVRAVSAADGAEIAVVSEGGAGGNSGLPRGGGHEARTIPIASDTAATKDRQAPSASVLLKFWWRQASPEERAQFLGWIEE